jgi:hypothetical protein
MTPYTNQPAIRALMQRPAPGLRRVLDALRHMDDGPPPRADGNPLENGSGFPSSPAVVVPKRGPMRAPGCPALLRNHVAS